MSDPGRPDAFLVTGARRHDDHGAGARQWRRFVHGDGPHRCRCQKARRRLGAPVRSSSRNAGAAPRKKWRQRRVSRHPLGGELVEIVLPILRLVAAELEQIVPRENAGRVHVVEHQAHGVVADRIDLQDRDVAACPARSCARPANAPAPRRSGFSPAGIRRGARSYRRRRTSRSASSGPWPGAVRSASFAVTTFNPFQAALYHIE